MNRLSLVLAVSVSLTSLANAELFYSLDRSQHPGPISLIQFDSDSGNTNRVPVAQVPGLPTDPLASNLELTADGRLFAATNTGVVYEIDIDTGDILNQVTVADAPVEGLAVSDTGVMYASVENGGRFFEVDFDAGISNLLFTHSFDIDGIDFDGDGNLIGSDVNQTGQVFNIPLDGSQPIVIATLPIANAIADLAFSPTDSAFYSVGREQDPEQLWRIPWENGAPSAAAEFVKAIGPGDPSTQAGLYQGLTVVPEPSTGLLFILAFPLAIRRRR